MKTYADQYLLKLRKIFTKKFIMTFDEINKEYGTGAGSGWSDGKGEGCGKGNDSGDGIGWSDGKGEGCGYSIGEGDEDCNGNSYGIGEEHG